MSDTYSSNMMEWNVKAGGFDSNSPEQCQPEREREILGVVALEHTVGGVRTAVFSDASRWDTVYGGDAGIAARFGFQQARFAGLGDKRFKDPNGSGSGIALLTDEAIAFSEPLDLGNRQGLLAVLDIGKHGLQVAGVYLDDMDEDLRRRQVKAMLAGLEPDVPTILTGDFNTLRSHLQDASAMTRFGDMAVRLAARTLPKKPKTEQGSDQPDDNEEPKGIVAKVRNLGESIGGMNRREVIGDVLEAGFQDGDQLSRGTAPVWLPGFSIDYAFARAGRADGLMIDKFSVRSAPKASDHRYIKFRVNLAA